MEYVSGGRAKKEAARQENFIILLAFAMLALASIT
jgi:hypothetical protein